MKKVLLLISILLCMTLLFTGCGGSSKPADSENEASDDEGDNDESDSADEVGETQDEPEETQDLEDESEEMQDAEDDSDDSEKVDSSNLKSISDFSDYWSDVYSGNEAAINAYDGMPIMEIVYPGLCFITGVQYDLLNMDNKDGRFDGELMFAGYKGFVEKNGPEYTFGYEDALDEDGFAPTMKAGDKKIENGNCNLAEGSYFSDSYTERDGVVISRSVNEFKIEDDGSISTFLLDGNLFDLRNEENISNTYTFVRSGEDQFDFVVAKAQIGTDFEVLSLEADMTKDMAVAMFEAAGLTIETSGGIVNGEFTLD